VKITRVADWLALVVGCALALQAALAGGQDFTGVVTKVFDGDSFLVRPVEPAKGSSGKPREIDVRLLGIDAPEKNQPHGAEARAALAKLIGNRRVFVDVIDTDRYDRKLARVYREPDRLDVTRALVHDGHVWVYRRTLKDRSLIELEDSAKAGHQGLWALPERERMPPWQFRYLERQRKAATAQ
jgi:endonuclease YncB( thermonuclease family)